MSSQSPSRFAIALAAAQHALFVVLLVRGLQAASHADRFGALLATGIVCWLAAQGFENLGMNLGLLPVTGLQLPLISAGGTSTATTLFMIGVMANAARHEPEAVAALRAGRDDRMNRLLRLP